MNTKAIEIQPAGKMNVCSKNSSDISSWTKMVDHVQRGWKLDNVICFFQTHCMIEWLNNQCLKNRLTPVISST